MHRGIAINIGVGRRDTTKHEGWSELPAATQDARDMYELAVGLGYEATLLVDRQATRAAVDGLLHEASHTLRTGDTLLITFAGHGDNSWSPATERKLPDEPPGTDNPPVEEDHWDEVICLYDGDYIDNDLYSTWSSFDDGVRIVLVADSCHAGSVISLQFDADKIPQATAATVVTPPQRRPTIQRHVIPPIVMLMAASEDDSSTPDGAVNGAFTAGLLRAWASKPAPASYRDLFERTSSEARKDFPLIRTSYRIIGPDVEAMKRFELEPPFALNGSRS